jgi:hypothetical protein
MKDMPTLEDKVIYAMAKNFFVFKPQVDKLSEGMQEVKDKFYRTFNDEFTIINGKIVEKHEVTKFYAPFGDWGCYKL